MDSEVKKYILEQCRDWMLEEEIIAINRFGLTKHGKETTQKLALVNDEIEIVYGYNNEKVNELVELGKIQAEEAIAKRVLQDNPNILNKCPKCNGLTRTPRARQCRHCLHNWF